MNAMTKIKMEKAPKGMPTSLNLWTLNREMKGRRSARALFAPTSMPALRKCLKAGLLAVVDGYAELTDLGGHALCGYALDLGRTPYGWQNADLHLFGWMPSDVPAARGSAVAELKKDVSGYYVMIDGESVAVETSARCAELGERVEVTFDVGYNFWSENGLSRVNYVRRSSAVVVGYAKETR